jgi:hypothetical protein
MPACHRLLVLAVAVLALGAATALAQDPVYWEANGHYYELVQTPVTWHDAEYLAEQRMYMNRTGHLATLTSQEENEFVFWFVVGGNQDTPLGDPWLGGYQNSDESPPGDNWFWVTDEAWDYTNWDDGEPNDYDEPYAEMFLNYQLWGDGTWNDHHSLNLKGFVVEYSTGVVRNEQVTLTDVKSLFQ